MSVDGVWGTVCGYIYGFTDNVASLICKNMSYSGGYVAQNGYYGKGGGKIWMGSFSCGRNIESIFGCSLLFGDDLPPRCTHDYDVGVYCYQNGKYI